VRRDLLLYGNIFYFTTLIFLYWWMKDRDAYNPKAFMRFYNLTCVALAGTSGVCIALHKWYAMALLRRRLCCAG
jgi:hypothetical protein